MNEYEPLAEISSSAAETGRLQFGIGHLLYVLAQVGVSLDLLGAWGLLVAGGIVFFWWGVLRQEFSGIAFLKYTVAVLLLLLLLSCLLWPSLGVGRSPSRKAECLNNLAQLSKGLLQYRFTHGEFPPVCLKDDQGRPMHSWRVLILPYADRQDLFERYDFNEPWDGPNNSKLAGMMPRFYRCPTRRYTGKPEDMITSYVAYSGGNSPWGGEEIDPAAPLIIEANEHALHWMSPHDPAAKELFHALTQGPANLEESNHANVDFLSMKSQGRSVSFVDSSTRFLPEQLPPHIARIFLNGTDDPHFDLDSELDKIPSQEYRWRDENIFRLASFIVVSCFPLVWLRWRRDRHV